MEQELLDEFENKSLRKRPVLLTVLCILTWTGSALLLVLGSIKLTEHIQWISRYWAIPGFKMDVYYYLKMWSFIALLVCCLLCIVAAIAMWKLKRRGFYLYVAAQIIPVFMEVLTELQLPELLGGFNPMVFSKAVFPLVFIALYAINLKYLQRSRKRTVAE